ncbi:amidase [Brevibacterium spongiae]|uniref:Amidase n=1 Tax=Brevibacterium spongiae TaxID=2909672 RepID=A0ABY5SP34_9MICO|nr:amidase [Brevibacterium spongiae]UVI36327.1 amidase [Brevibacterium spongiae]
MSTTTENHDAHPAARINGAVDNLLGSAGNDRAESLVAASATEIDRSFTPPSPPQWLKPGGISVDSSDSRWTSTVDESPRTGIFRRYTESTVAGATVLTEELSGLRITHKDNIGIRDYPITAGSPALSDTRAEATSPLLRSIEAAGGTIIGANHMAEFALSPTGHNQWFGDGVNPLSDSHLSGGSSSGSGVSVATDACDLSLGTDTGGSVRLPAAYCGLVGYKPTNGLFTHSGLIPLSETLDTIGLLASDTTIVQRAFEVLISDSAVVNAEARSRIDVSEEAVFSGFAHLSRSTVDRDCDTEVASAFASALDVVKEIGQSSSNDFGCLDERGVDIDDADLNRKSVTIVSVEAARNVGSLVGWNWDLLGDQVLSRVIRGTAIPAIGYADALACRSALAAEFLDKAMGRSRFLLTPTSPILAPQISKSDATGSRARSDYMRASSYTRTINYLGLPAITVPLPTAGAELSPALQLIGRHYDDRALLTVAATIAEACRQSQK